MPKSTLKLLGDISTSIIDLEIEIMKACCSQKSDTEITEIRSKINLARHLKFQVENRARGFKKAINISNKNYTTACSFLIMNHNKMSYKELLEAVQSILLHK